MALVSDNVDRPEPFDVPVNAEIVGLVLLTRPGLDKRELLEQLREIGLPIGSTSELNAFLYAHKREFEWRPEGSRRLWYVRGAPVMTQVVANPTDSEVAESATTLVESLQLYAWQQRALAAWSASGNKGVVEAVTGAGKTRLALQATLDALANGEKVAVLVPTLELMRQWCREIDTHVVPRSARPVRIGTLGGGSSSDFGSCDLLVASASSAARWELGSSAHHALLIADECHHYGADTWSQGLEDGFTSRLGLTATYEREDNGLRDWLEPYFGGVCYSVGYEEALRDDVIAPFRIAFVGARFDAQEQSIYDEAASKAGRYRARLIREYGLPAEPFGAFMREVQRLRSASVEEYSRVAGFYLAAFQKRRAIMAQARSKLQVVGSLEPAVRDATRTIVFAQTVVAADQAIGVLQGAGHSGVVIEASMDSEERRQAFDSFERGDYSVVAAPRLLDEGVDVPAADLAIVLATSRSRRQLIQRMGRVIRKKPDARAARVVILYVEGTPEDPATGAHEDFLDEVVVTAEDVRVFPPGTNAQALTHYLKP